MHPALPSIWVCTVAKRFLPATSRAICTPSSCAFSQSLRLSGSSAPRPSRANDWMTWEACTYWLSMVFPEGPSTVLVPFLPQRFLLSRICFSASSGMQPLMPEAATKRSPLAWPAFSVLTYLLRAWLRLDGLDVVTAAICSAIVVTLPGGALMRSAGDPDEATVHLGEASLDLFERG